MKKSMWLGAGLLALSMSSQAGELFLTLNSGSAMTQGAGLVLASQAVEQKATVRVLEPNPLVMSRPMHSGRAATWP